MDCQKEERYIRRVGKRKEKKNRYDIQMINRKKKGEIKAESAFQLKKLLHCYLTLIYNPVRQK